MNADPAQPVPSLSALSDAWQRFGCSICSHVPTPHAAQGARIELHHILPRARGGGDDPDNLMGLCGELCEGKCHWKVTTNRIKINWAANVNAWVWTDTKQNITGICRPLDAELIEEAGVGHALVLSKQTLRRTLASDVPDEWVIPEGLPTEHSPAGAQERFMMIRELARRIERDSLRLTLLLQFSLSHQDHTQLGFGTVGEWADAIGIEKATMSRLRLVGKMFQGAWVDLPPADQAMLTLDRLYVAARMVKLKQWTLERGLQEAVSKPAAQLWREHMDLHHSREQCTCPTCGQWHHKKLEPPLE